MRSLLEPKILRQGHSSLSRTLDYSEDETTREETAEGPCWMGGLAHKHRQDPGTELPWWGEGQREQNAICGYCHDTDFTDVAWEIIST